MLFKWMQKSFEYYLKVKELIEAGDSLIDFLLGISFPIGSTFLGSQQTVSKRLLVQLRLFYFFLNGPTRASFPFIFGLFKQTLQFLQQIDVKKCPSSIQRQDLNPRTFIHESSPITTRPELPPFINCWFINWGGFKRNLFAKTYFHITKLIADQSGDQFNVKFATIKSTAMMSKVK